MVWTEVGPGVSIVCVYLSVVVVGTYDVSVVVTQDM
jgi:hypothetical protein